MRIKIIAILFAMFVIAVIVQADRGALPPALARYRVLPGADVLGHFVLIGILALLVNLAIGARTVTIIGRQCLVGSVVVGLLVFLEEFSQLYIPVRSFSLLDLTADGLGIACAGFLVGRWAPDRKVRTEPKGNP